MSSRELEMVQLEVRYGLNVVPIHAEVLGFGVAIDALYGMRDEIVEMCDFRRVMEPQVTILGMSACKTENDRRARLTNAQKAFFDIAKIVESAR